MNGSSHTEPTGPPVFHRALLIAALFAFAVAGVVGAAQIHDLARTGDLEQVKNLIDQSPDLLNALNEEEETPLHFAAASGNLDLVEYLVSSGAEVDAPNNVGQTPLLYAAYDGHVEICEFLIRVGAKADFRDGRGNSPLDFAARQGQLDVVALLIAEGAEIDRDGRDGRTPLWYAASTGQLEIVKLLARDGADVTTTDDGGESVLLVSLNRGHPDVADWLADHGALVDIDTLSLNALLIQAASMGLSIMVESLFAEGASLHASNATGKTILHAASIGGLEHLATNAIGQGIPVNDTDSTGRTPLHYAVSADNVGMVELLIQNGADANVKAGDGRTPLNIAEDWHHESMIDLLIANGARQEARSTYKIGGGGGRGRAEITYIANEGFLLSDGEQKIIIDALVDNPWGYVSTNTKIFEMMLAGNPPFDDLNLCIGSHVHADHNVAAMTLDLLRKQPGVTFVSNQPAITELMDAAGADYGTIAPRVVNMNPEWGTTKKHSSDGTSAAFFGVNHAGPNSPRVMTLATIVEVGGIRMVHLADEVAETSAEYIRAALVNGTIDIAFVDPFFLEDPVGQALIEETIRPTYIILMHLRVSELDTYAEKFKTSRPPVVIFREPMETKIFETTQ
ncbi:MAG: ankyrin repeat domain-containing protein [Candidatus Latescibacterota bacterium]|nr:MAG: ankyrin repeat domain-containing protein [Candidatus Latescibacterota bacterium]